MDGYPLTHDQNRAHARYDHLLGEIERLKQRIKQLEGETE